MAIRIASATFTPEQILAMGVTPLLVLAAPAAGYARNYLGISHDMDFNTLAYTGDPSLIYLTNAPGYNYIFFDDVTLIAEADVTVPCQKATTPNLPFTTTRALYVSTTGTPAVGNSSVTAYIVYQDILIDT